MTPADRCKLVAYYRVSTVGQGASGLGLEAQEAAVDAYAKHSGCVVMASFKEVESGKRSDRPQLAKAIEAAKRMKATLVIAKLDRLARNVHFISGLMESGVDFVACDNPTANRLTVHILAAVAEDEARRISERTKAALTAYKARGGLLGASLPQCRNLTAEARQRGQEAATNKASDSAREWNKGMAPTIKAMLDEGLSWNAIAKALNAKGILTQRGKAWRHSQVKNIVERYINA